MAAGEMAIKMLTYISTALGIFKWLAVFLIVVGFGAGIFFWRWNNKRYSYIIEIWGNSGGVPEVIALDTARPIRVRVKEGIASLLYIRKLKRYAKMPPRTMIKGNKIRYWFRKDGELQPIELESVKILSPREWWNRRKELTQEEEEGLDMLVPMAMEDINDKMAVMKVKFINEDARLAHVSTGRIVREMFNVNKFFKEYGHTLLMILGVMVLGIVLVLIFDGLKDYYASAGSVSAGADKVAIHLEEVEKRLVLVLDKMDTMIKQPPPG